MQHPIINRKLCWEPVDTLQIISSKTLLPLVIKLMLRQPTQTIVKSMFAIVCPWSFCPNEFVTTGRDFKNSTYIRSS